MLPPPPLRSSVLFLCPTAAPVPRHISTALLRCSTVLLLGAAPLHYFRVSLVCRSLSYSSTMLLLPLCRYCYFVLPKGAASMHGSPPLLPPRPIPAWPFLLCQLLLLLPPQPLLLVMGPNCCDGVNQRLLLRHLPPRPLPLCPSAPPSSSSSASSSPPPHVSRHFDPCETPPLCHVP